MLRRVVSVKPFFAQPRVSIVASLSLSTTAQAFSSNYNDSSQNKSNASYLNRAGGRQPPPAKSSTHVQKQTTAEREGKVVKQECPGTYRKDYNVDLEEEEWETSDNLNSNKVIPPQRSIKNHYKDLFKPEPERLCFRSTFAKTKTNTIAESPGRETKEDTESIQVCEADFEDEEADITKIYSNDEVQHLVQGLDEKKGSVCVPTYKDDVGISETPKKKDATEETKIVFNPSKDIDVVSYEGIKEVGMPASQSSHAAQNAKDDVDVEDEVDNFASVRRQSFFAELLRCVEKNMMRYRKEVRQTNRYSRDLINDCVRPLLQLTDFPFTAHKLAELTNCINPIILRRSLNDYSACKRLHIYRSEDTELLLDWSVEDFLRRRYESIHLSWERMEVVYRRFGWDSTIFSDRDCLLYFAEFSEFVELAELEVMADGKPKAIVISDLIAQAAKRPIPASRLLIRRHRNADVEPSVTESVRLLGSPAIVDKAAQRDKAQHYSRLRNNESVSGMFAAVEKAAEEVEGHETLKLAHAIDSVPSLKQATHPKGRIVREFSIGKTVATDNKQEQRLTQRQEGECVDSGEEERADDSARISGNKLPNSYDAKLHESLSNAYHKNKVETAMLRRRLMSTRNADELANIQAKLLESRKEFNCLIDQLRCMRQLKQASKQEAKSETTNSAVVGSKSSVAFSIPNDQPDFPEAPEYDSPKNVPPAEDMEEEDIDISKELQKFETEMSASVLNATTPKNEQSGVKPVHAHTPHQNCNQRTAAMAKRENIVPNTQNVADSTTLNSVEDAVENEEEFKDEWCDAHDLATKAEEDTLDDRSAKVSTSQPSSFTSSPKKKTSDNKVATSRSEKLRRLCEEVSSAARNAQDELEAILHEKREQESAMVKRVQAATHKARTLEAKLEALQSDYEEAREAEAREAAQAQAQAVEEELQREREIREAELARQREQVRLAQLETQKAFEQQRAAEQAVLATERELHQVRTQLGFRKEPNPVYDNGNKKTVPAPQSELVNRAKQLHSDQVVTSRKSEPTSVKTSSTSVEATPTTTTLSSNSFFMCTPEQYDGMQLAAARLRAEITSLEKQMEQEGEEDDETLMTVLAASRADLEELDACIASVQQHAKWVAERDAQREREERARENASETESQRVQKQIAEKRFEISLLERRLQHATERSVINKLEQAIIGARRQISSLRIEQDRLRQAGMNEFGLPPSISMAKALADEAKEDAEEIESPLDIPSSEGPEGSTESAQHGANDIAEEQRTEEDYITDTETLEAQEEVSEIEHDDDSGAEPLSKASRYGEDNRPTARNAEQCRETSCVTSSESLVNADPDTHNLHLRLQSMLRDIQHLQDSISHQESTSSYDEDEAEAVLIEMRKKLSQLLHLRDDVQKRLVEAMSNSKNKQQVVHTSPSTHTPPDPPLMRSRVAPSIVSSGVRTPSIPLPHLHTESIHSTSSSRKHHRATLKGRMRK